MSKDVDIGSLGFAHKYDITGLAMPCLGLGFRVWEVGKLARFGICIFTSQRSKFITKLRPC